MALTPSFTSSQTLGAPNLITLTDTSTGTDLSVVSRRVTFTDFQGDNYVEEGTTTSYEVWADFPSTTTITLDILTRDRALRIKVDWVDVNGNVVNTETVLTNCNKYALDFYVNTLIKSQSSRRTLIDHANFYNNEIRLLCSLREAKDAVELIADIASAQGALDRAHKIINSPSNFF